MDRHEVDRAIARLATRQHGVFAGRQAIELGATHRMIEHRVDAGLWVELDHFTFGFPSHAPGWRRALMAAVLAESGAAVDGRSAARLHTFAGFGAAPIEIVVAPGSNHRSRLATVHERRDVQLATVEGIPVVTAVDTVFSLAAAAARRSISPGRIRFAVDDGVAHGLFRVPELQRRYAQLASSRRAGLPLMRALLLERDDAAYVPPSTLLESKLYEVMDAPGMPRYRRQVRLAWSGDETVDAMLVDEPVIVEADGRRWHTRVADFERDRRRDRTAALHGYRTLRYTWDDLVHRRADVVAELRAVALTGNRSA